MEFVVELRHRRERSHKHCRSISQYDLIGCQKLRTRGCSSIHLVNHVGQCLEMRLHILPVSPSKPCEIANREGLWTVLLGEKPDLVEKPPKSGSTESALAQNLLLFQVHFRNSCVVCVYIKTLAQKVIQFFIIENIKNDI